jgi:hypothetical protein
MKILLVGDHRDAMNWGGRGQSIALAQLLGRRFEIADEIAGETVGDYSARGCQVGTLLPYKYFRFLRSIRGKIKPIDWYLRVEELLGAHDFVTNDPLESAANVIRYKSKNPELAQIFEKIAAADLVVINGEGSGVFSTPFRRDFFFHLAMVELAAKLEKQVFYVNGILSDCPFTGRNSASVASARKTLSKCNAVLVRDPESLEYVQTEMPEVTSEYIPDALFTWFPKYEQFGASVPPNGDFVIPPIEKNEYFGKLDFSRPYICIGGSSWAAQFRDQAVEHYLRLLEGVRRLGFPVYVTQNCAGDSFLQEVARISGCGLVPWNTPIMMAGAILANASVFVSGRFHAAIFASLGGTPCVFLDAHSHKMSSLQRTLEYDIRKLFPAMPADLDVDEIVSLSRQYIEEGEPLRDRIKAVAGRRSEEAERLPQRILDHL